MAELPLAVVYVLGLVMALLQMQRLPRVAAIAGGGFGGLLLILLVQPFVNNLIHAALRSDPQSISVMFTLTGFVFNVLKAIAMGAVGFAIFVDRPEVQLPIGNRPANPHNPGRMMMLFFSVLTASLATTAVDLSGFTTRG